MRGVANMFYPIRPGQAFSEQPSELEVRIPAQQLVLHPRAGGGCLNLGCYSWIQAFMCLVHGRAHQGPRPFTLTLDTILTSCFLWVLQSTAVYIKEKEGRVLSDTHKLQPVGGHREP